MKEGERKLDEQIGIIIYYALHAFSGVSSFFLAPPASWP
jgi:hypothetical protein